MIQNQINDKPELVCPAGDMASLLTSLDSGADSLYMGIRGINMRAGARNFELSQLPLAVEKVKEKKKKIYITLNTIIMQGELPKVVKILDMAKETGVDGIIFWDLSLINLIKERGLEPHLSTQASVSNFESLKFYSSLGVKRVVPARECTLSQIKEINTLIEKEKISCILETFVHGAMCVSHSGRCFLSLETFEKSANRGECLQPCRREFEIKETKGKSSYILGKDYLLSPKDLCTIDFLDKIAEAGVQAFKIEGRMRSKEYLRVVVSSYRKAIDWWFKGEYTQDKKEMLKSKLLEVYNRGFSSGFYFGRPVDWISRKLEHVNEKLHVGIVRKFYKKISVAEICLTSRGISLKDTLFCSGKNISSDFFTVKEIQKEHIPIKSAEKGDLVAVKIPFVVRKGDQVFLWGKKKV